jgi:hypothetical protein
MLPIHMGLFKFWFLHLKYWEDYEKYIYIINHIPIKQMWLEENIILIKDVQIWVDQKMLMIIMKKNVIYSISKDQNSKIG